MATHADIAHFNQLLISVLLEANYRSAQEVGELFSLDPRSVAILRTIDHQRQQELIRHCNAILAVPAFTEAELTTLAASETSAGNDDAVLWTLNLEYLQLIKQLALTNIRDSSYRLQTSPSLALTVKNFTGTTIRKIAQTASKPFFRVNISPVLARTIQGSNLALLPYLATVAGTRRVGA